MSHLFLFVEPGRADELGANVGDDGRKDGCCEHKANAQSAQDSTSYLVALVSSEAQVVILTKMVSRKR